MNPPPSSKQYHQLSETKYLFLALKLTATNFHVPFQASNLRLRSFFIDTGALSGKNMACGL